MLQAQLEITKELQQQIQQLKSQTPSQLLFEMEMQNL